MSVTGTLEVPGYQVMQYLGSGARSTIWQIRDRSTDECFALKRVVKRQVSDSRFLQQAINEYDVGTHLDHAVVRHIYKIRRITRWFSLREIHLIMELCHGQTVQDRRPDDILRAVKIFGEVASALAYMNARGYVHADMKPNNILVAPDGTVKIIDLGQSCRVGTVKQRVQGTPDFISPEQVHRWPLDARTDVFNLGAAMYWVLTGRPIATALPKNGLTLLKGELLVHPPEQINPEVPASLSKLVMDCVELHPSHRPGTMNEVTSRLTLIEHTLNRKAESPNNS